MTASSDSMRAVLLSGHGGLDKLDYRERWPKPVPQPDEVLVRVRACGLNNTDVNTRTAWYAQSDSSADGAWGGAAISFPLIQGADAVGVVESVGGNANPNLLGRRVMIDPWLRDWNAPLNLDKCGYFGSECHGGFAEYTTVHQRNAHPIECDLSDAELATFATSAITAEHMLTRVQVGVGDEVLITGASGGVGSALIQLCKRRGATSIALCAKAKAERVRELGADLVLAYASLDKFDLRAALREELGHGQVSVVADLIGGDLWPQLINALGRGGRYACAGAIAGSMVNLDLRIFYLRNLLFAGATVTPPGLFANLVRYIEQSKIRPLLAATYPLAQLREAQQAFMDKRQVGNIVVTMEDAP